jgi:hypothetical protein
MISPQDQKLVAETKRKVVSNAKEKGIAHIYPPPSIEEIEQTEAAIGAKLPPLVRELYVQIGNGGFGPGWGITGLLTGKKIYERTLVENFRNTAAEIKAHLLQSIEEAEQSTPVDQGMIEQDRQHYENWRKLNRDHLIWYCDWGCNIVTLVDYTEPELPIYCADALNLLEEPSKTLREWWHRWLDDSLNSY